jgi:hypothetical protein
MAIQTWFDKNKVFLLGLLSSIAVAITPLLNDSPENVTYKVLGFALATAVLSYISNAWRGQGLTLLGIIGNLAGVATTVVLTGNIAVPQLIIQVILAIAMAAGADPKSRGYEQTGIIRQAKVEGEMAQPSTLTSVSVKKEAEALKTAE